jgi:N-acetylmuramoyl-L-alanine amidase
MMQMHPHFNFRPLGKIAGLLLALIVLFFPSFVFAQNTNPSVCIDPGHGGTDTGAVNGDILEKDLNLDVAGRLAMLLNNSGYIVYQTRTGDQTFSNSDRYNFCNSNNATILVSIHHDGSSDPSIDYSQALYMKKTDVDLAKVVVNGVSSKLNTTNHGISRFASGVLLKSKMPAAISEAFFLTNTAEYTMLKDPTSTRRQDEAVALYNGITNYFANH